MVTVAKQIRGTMLEQLHLTGRLLTDRTVPMDGKESRSELVIWIGRTNEAGLVMDNNHTPVH